MQLSTRARLLSAPASSTEISGFVHKRTLRLRLDVIDPDVL